jgi:hypothetical protein
MQLLAEVPVLLVVVGTRLHPMLEVKQQFFLVGIKFQQSWNVNL